MPQIGFPLPMHWQASEVFYLKFVAVRISAAAEIATSFSTQLKTSNALAYVLFPANFQGGMQSHNCISFILRLACPIYNSAKHSPNKGMEHPQYLFTLYCLLSIYAYSVHWKLSDYSDFKVVYFSYLIYATVNGCNISKRVLIITYNSSCNRENILPLQLLMMAEPRKMHSLQVILFWHTKMLLSNNLYYSHRSEICTSVQYILA